MLRCGWLTPARDPQEWQAKYEAVKEGKPEPSPEAPVAAVKAEPATLKEENQILADQVQAWEVGVPN